MVHYPVAPKHMVEQAILNDITFRGGDSTYCVDLHKFNLLLSIGIALLQDHTGCEFHFNIFAIPQIRLRLAQQKHISPGLVVDEYL